jgi:hypothetical protein
VTGIGAMSLQSAVAVISDGRGRFPGPCVAGSNPARPVVFPVPSGPYEPLLLAGTQRSVEGHQDSKFTQNIV